MLPLPAASQTAAAPVPKPALRLYKRHAEVVGGGERQILGDTINVGSDPVGVIDIVMIGDLDQYSRCGCAAQLGEGRGRYGGHKLLNRIDQLEIVGEDLGCGAAAAAVAVVIDIRSLEHACQILGRGVGMDRQMEVVVSGV